ncbi:MAG: hypothetical protein WCH04_17785 [Gammaproteobacteria bacterium]
MTGDNVSNNDLYEIDALIEDGKFDNALEKHLWFHEASRESPGMGGVRLSFALESWLDLANKYSPAMDSLIQLRDGYKDTLLKGNGTFDNFHDLFAINQYLENDGDTYSVFMKLHENYPEQAKSYYHVVEDIIVEKNRYDICAAYIADPMKKYKHIEKLHKLNKDFSRKHSGPRDKEFGQYTEDSYTKGVCQLIEVLSALGNDDVAKEIQATALKYIDNETIKAAI